MTPFFWSTISSWIKNFDKIGIASDSYRCDNLKTIYIPKSIKYIHTDAFYGCDNIQNIYYEGSEEEWLESLKGDTGAGLDINDIYQAAIANGFEGTFEEFLRQYFQDTSIEGKSAYEIAVENGYKGTEEEWLASLKGETGMAGSDGEKGDSIDLYATYLKLVELGEIDCSFLEFVQKYLNVDLNSTNQYAISKAILSAVKIITTNDVLVDDEGNYNTDATGKSGAGVIYKINKASGDAYIITNYHVAYDTDSKAGGPMKYVYVNLLGNQYLDGAIPAKCIGGSATYDIAVLEIKNSEILRNSDAKAIEVFNSNNLVAGTKAIAIGNPQGEGIAVTEGIVSVDSEEIYMDPLSKEDVTLTENGEVEMRVIRFDAAINQGNSGGGLFNEKAELIGIVNAKIISSSIVGFSYAIPSNIAVNVADNLIRNYNGVTPSKVIKCLVGIQISVTNSYTVYDAQTSTTKIVEDVVVYDVSLTSSLYGKLQKGDIIKTIIINGETLEVTRNFVILDACLKADVGTNATMIIKRGNQIISYDFTFKSSTIIG